MPSFGVRQRSKLATGPVTIVRAVIISAGSKLKVGQIVVLQHKCRSKLRPFPNRDKRSRS